jgi:hypothetical protein
LNEVYTETGIEIAMIETRRIFLRKNQRIRIARRAPVIARLTIWSIFYSMVSALLY